MLPLLRPQRNSKLPLSLKTFFFYLDSFITTMSITHNHIIDTKVLLRVLIGKLSILQKICIFLIVSNEFKDQTSKTIKLIKCL